MENANPTKRSELKSVKITISWLMQELWTIIRSIICPSDADINGTDLAWFPYSHILSYCWYGNKYIPWPSFSVWYWKSKEVQFERNKLHIRITERDYAGFPDYTRARLAAGLWVLTSSEMTRHASLLYYSLHPYFTLIHTNYSLHLLFVHAVVFTHTGNSHTHTTRGVVLTGVCSDVCLKSGSCFSAEETECTSCKRLIEELHHGHTLRSMMRMHSL